MWNIEQADNRARATADVHFNGSEVASKTFVDLANFSPSYCIRLQAALEEA